MSTIWIRAGSSGKIGLVVTALFIFMVFSNISTWKANILSPMNWNKSIVGSAIQKSVAQGSQDSDNGKFRIARDSLVGRIFAPENATPYISMPIITDQTAIGNIDDAEKMGGGWRIRGWTYVPESAGTAEFIIAVEEGRVVGTLPIAEQRPDVEKALATEGASRSGYAGQITSEVGARDCKLQIFILTSRLELLQGPNLCEKVKSAISR